MARSVCAAFILSFALFFVSARAYANSGELMNFQYLGDLQPVGNFYNGDGLTSTPNYGVTFSSNFFGLRSYQNGGPGNFAANLTGTPAIFINGTTGLAATGIMNVTPGFSNGLNFFFSAGFASGQNETVTIWSGANGTGTVLATITLANNNAGCTAPLYCNWTDVGVSLCTANSVTCGTAHSVTFSGPANQLGISDITIGSTTTGVPEPSSIYLLGTGLAAVSLGKLRGYFRC